MINLLAQGDQSKRENGKIVSSFFKNEKHQNKRAKEVRQSFQLYYNNIDQSNQGYIKEELRENNTSLMSLKNLLNQQSKHKILQQRNMNEKQYHHKAQLNQQNESESTENTLNKNKTKNMNQITILKKLQNENLVNQKIMSEMKKRIKQLEAKLACYELSNQQLRLKLHQKTIQLKILNEKIEQLMQQKIDIDIKTKNYLLGLEQKIQNSKINYDQENSLIKQSMKKLKTIKLQMNEEKHKDTNNIKCERKNSFKLKNFMNQVHKIQQQISFDNKSLEISSASFLNPEHISTITQKLLKIEVKLEQISQQHNILKQKNKVIEQKIFKVD